MQKPIPWGLRGGEINIREAARNAARREGMSLNAWFAQAVGEYAAEIDVDPAELTEDEHAEAIAAKLRHLAAAPRPAGLGSRAKTRQPRIGERTDRAPRSRPREMRSEETLLEKAFRRLERSPQSAPDFEAAPPPRRSRLEPELAARRAVAVARRPSLASAVAEISRRQRDLEEAEVPVASRFAAPRYGEEMAGAATLENLRGDIAALANQIQGLRRDQAERTVAPAVCNLDKLSGEISAMSVAMRGLSERGSTAPLESAIRNLTQQIETSRGDGMRETVLLPLERLVSDLRLALAEVDPRTTIRGLETEVKKLGSKLDSLGRSHIDSSAINLIDTRTREIREMLSAATSQSVPIERIGRQIEALSERFDQLRELQDRRPLGREDSDLAAVAEEIRLLTGERGTSAFAKIEDQLATIGAKVDQALAEARDESRYTALANRINDVHEEFAERAAQATAQLDIKGLERLVLGLAEKIDSAKRPEADGHAIEALQRQVSEFAARLDQSNAGFPSLVSLEHSIANLFAELEHTRDASYAAAEKAARNVLEEVKQKVPQQHTPELAQDILDLRTMQDEADRRTLATLNAVHETLERVVDRLALVETEIADVRTKPQELLASGPAPNFAPATARMPDSLVASRPALVHSVRAAAQALSEEDDKDATDMLDDFLIEPGRGLPGSRGPSAAETDTRANAADAFDLSEASTGRAGFIAAARRAAQAAQMESATALRQPMARAEGTTGLVDQTRHFIAQHKRPVVLSVAALFLAMGAYAVVKTVGHAPLELPNGGKANPPEHSTPANPVPAPSHGALSTPPASPAPKPTAAMSPIAPAPIAPAQVAPAPSADAAGVGTDPIVTGTIGSRAFGIPGAKEPEAVSTVALQKVAESGNAKAQYELATDYATGHGVGRDLHLALQWYEKAAQQGLAPAQYRLGSLYEKGLGVTRNANQAMAWYRKAADRGNVRAMHNLAVLTAEGGDNGKPDYANAAQWFRKAAEYGVKDSQYNVAILLARGLGVPQNLTLSYVWFAAAAAQGDEDAASKRDDVGARLSAADLAAAKATAAAFRAKVPDPAANDVEPPAGGWTAPAAKPGRPKVSQL